MCVCFVLCICVSKAYLFYFNKKYSIRTTCTQITTQINSVNDQMHIKFIQLQLAIIITIIIIIIINNIIVIFLFKFNLI